METSLAYLAGIIDGEGCIVLRFRPRDGGIVPRLQIVNTNSRLIEWIDEHFAGGGIYRAKRVGQPRPQHKQLVHWHLNGQHAIDLLRLVRPYLVIKAAQSDLATFAWENRQPTPLKDRRKPIDASVREMRMGWVAEMHALNQKGVAMVA